MRTQYYGEAENFGWVAAALGAFIVLCLALSGSAQEKGGYHDDGVRPGRTTADIEKTREKTESAPDWQARSGASAVAPLNDNFANASLLGAAYSGVVTNVGATAESGEPSHGAGRGADNPSQNNSLWYKIVAPANGVIEFSSSAPQSDPIGDTVLSAYTGSTVSSLTPVAENDDYVNTYYSKITFGVTAGQTYYIAVDGYRAATGNIQLHCQFTLAPANDNSYSAEDLDNVEKSPFIGITGSTIGATGVQGETIHHANTVLPLNSIWYKWTSPASGTYTFTTEGSNFDTVIAVYFSLTGIPIGSRGSNDDFGPAGTLTSRVTFFAGSGETFLIAIDGYGSATGNTMLNWYKSYEESGKRFDLDGDVRSDISIFRPSNGQWWVKRSLGGVFAVTFGTAADKPTPADFTGDGKVDIAFWRPSDGYWYVLRSEDFSYYAVPFGTNGDIPTPGKFDNDVKADHAVFRPSTATWYVRRSRNGVVTQESFGVPGDVPVAVDYDGDAVTDIAIYRPSNGQWWINRSRHGLIAMTFGSPGDIPVPGPYTGRGFSNVAFWRPSSGEWFVFREFGSALYYSVPFGVSTDIPAPGDFDGDGKFDLTVFRPSAATWYVQRSVNGAVVVEPFGVNGDRPLESSYLP